MYYSKGERQRTASCRSSTGLLQSRHFLYSYIRLYFSSTELHFLCFNFPLMNIKQLRFFFYTCQLYPYHISSLPLLLSKLLHIYSLLSFPVLVFFSFSSMLSLSFFARSHLVKPIFFSFLLTT